MKAYFTLVFALFTFAICLATASTIFAQSPRSRISLNAGWRFLKADPPQVKDSDFNDREWQPVSIPHTWNALDAFDDDPGYHRGPAWYRRELKITKELASKQLFLYFEGVDQVTDVYVNGQKAGSHVGGYTAFSFDITPLIKRDERNIIAVRVDNSFNEDIPPLTADFNFYGGIYRDTWLIATDDVHFAMTDHASPGIRITTPDIERGEGTIAIGGTIDDAGANRQAEVTATVFDAANKKVVQAVSRVTLHGKTEFSISGLNVPKPKLWSPDSPYLYSVRTAITYNGKMVDEVVQPLGFRWFKFDPEKGFFLNGNHTTLRGANRHQDYAGLGNAVPDKLQVHDLELIKQTGFNFVRLAHYPQDPSVLDAADRLGIVLWEEIPIVNYITKSEAFTANSETMLREMIRQHRNHPSVVMWGYMNEIYLRVPKNRDDLYPATVELAKKLNKISHDEDPTRPTTIAFHGSEEYNKSGLGDVPDVIGWNLYAGWYVGKLEDFGPFLDDQHRRFPKRPLIVSEYGANADVRVHSTEPQRFDSTIEYQRRLHESYLSQINARPYISGSTLWNYFDFGVEYRGETIPHVNQKGMFTFDRKPKDIVYRYKAALSKENVLYVAARDWPERAGGAGREFPIDVYTNLTEAELSLNGKSLGWRTAEANKITWTVRLTNGLNVLAASGRGGSTRDSARIKYHVISAASPEIAINVGSNADYVDKNGRIWIADRPYEKGNWGYIGANASRILGTPGDRNILGTGDDQPFQTSVEGIESYQIDVTPGSYRVELSFAETKIEKPGQRIFEVLINSKTVIDKLDLAASPGAFRPLVRQFEVTTNRGIKVGFVPSVGKPILNRIRITRTTK